MPALCLAFIRLTVWSSLSDSIIVQPLDVVRKIDIGLHKFPASRYGFISMLLPLKGLVEAFPDTLRCRGRHVFYDILDRARF